MGKKTGLTLGKFAPLHKGHQLVIETALQEVDELIVIIYDCPETIDLPLSERAGWIRTLYPAVTVVEAYGGPAEVGDTPEIRHAHEQYIMNVLGIRDVTHFFSSEFYGKHISRALGAVDRRIDPERSRVAVSGTLIRKNPYAHREFLDPVVYRSFVKNILFLGAPSTGKTTLAEKLAHEHNTIWMPEYGREYWDAHQQDRRLTLEQLVEIAQGHIVREDKMLMNADRYLFTDTSALTTMLFSRYYHNAVHQKLDRLADLSGTRYDHVFLCDTDIPYDDTWDRSGVVMRDSFQQSYVEELQKREIAYHVLSGSIETRIASVNAVLEK